MSPKTKETWRILKSRGLFIYLLIAILGFACSGRWEWTGLISLSLVYLIFDLIGYEAVPTANDQKVLYPLQSYRILQFMFSVSIIVISLLAYNLFTMIQLGILWLSGTYDLMYYIVGRYPFHNNGKPIEWSWMQWTPYGIIKRKPLTTKEIVIQSIAGVGIVIILYII